MHSANLMKAVCVDLPLNAPFAVFSRNVCVGALFSVSPRVLYRLKSDCVRRAILLSNCCLA